VEPTPIPVRVSVEDIQLLIERRKAGKMTGVWLSIEAVESMLTEVRLYRNRYDPAHRRQRDAANAQRKARQKWDPIKYDD
jgi:dephospho-CoA kinase